MSEKNINEKVRGAEEKGGKEERKPGVFAKLKPLAEGAVVGFVSGALILGSCTKFTDFDMPSRHDAGSDAQVSDVNESDGRTKLENVPRDAKVEEEESEDATTSPDEEVEEAEEAVEEELADVPEEEEGISQEDIAEDEVAEIVEDEVSPEEEDVAVDPDAEVERDAPAEVPDVTENDGVEEYDVVTDVGTEEEVSVVCNAFDESRTVFIRLTETATVGNVSVRYDSYAGTDGTYSILCGDSVIREGIVISENNERSIDVPEQGFSVTLHVNTVRSWGSNVTVYVNAY